MGAARTIKSPSRKHQMKQRRRQQRQLQHRHDVVAECRPPRRRKAALVDDGLVSQSSRTAPWWPWVRSQVSMASSATELPRQAATTTTTACTIPRSWCRPVQSLDAVPHRMIVERTARSCSTRRQRPPCLEDRSTAGTHGACSSRTSSARTRAGTPEYPTAKGAHPDDKQPQVTRRQVKLANEMPQGNGLVLIGGAHGGGSRCGAPSAARLS